MSFKSVFLFVSCAFMASGISMSCYIGVVETASAHDELPTVTVPWTPQAPIVEPVAPAPQVLSQQVLYSMIEQPKAPQWPLVLTYRDAKSNSSYYRSWLEAQNPGLHFHAVRAIVTGYCPCSICCGKGAHGITRTGVSTDIEPYGVASPETFLRRHVHIPGYMFESEPGKFWKTDDTGGALNSDWTDRRTYHFDVRFMSHDWAKRYWGRREMTVYISE